MEAKFLQWMPCGLKVHVLFPVSPPEWNVPEPLLPIIIFQVSSTDATALRTFRRIRTHSSSDRNRKASHFRRTYRFRCRAPRLNENGTRLSSSVSRLKHHGTEKQIAIYLQEAQKHKTSFLPNKFMCNLYQSRSIIFL